jgi:hypothetical protein
LRVLAFPKFRLDRSEITALLGDLLPYEGCRESPSPQREEVLGRGEKHDAKVALFDNDFPDALGARVA